MPTYTLEWAKKAYQIDPDFSCLFFWGHRPNKDGSIGPSCFSQWWVSPFVVDGDKYHTAEHWMMAGKARLFGDKSMLKAILKSTDPNQAKKYGRKVKGFDPEQWDAHKFDLVVEGNWYKFGQHPRLKAFLLNTGKRVLVEASPFDQIWGIGLSKETPGIKDPNTWVGQNLLGFALMAVRDQLGQ